MKKYYYLYVYSVDMEGTHNLIKGKLFFNLDTAIDNAKMWLDMPGYHAQIVEGNNIVYDR